MAGKLYNKETGRYIADTAANRKRLGLSKKSSKKSTKKSTKKSSKRTSRKTRSKPTKGTCKCYYKGSEPSPKGKGYCAHCGTVGTVRVGKDRMKWKIKKRKTGSVYWARM